MQGVCKDKQENFNKALGAALSKLRKNSKLSSRAVAYSVDLSKTTILLAEKGKLDPQLSTFCKIAEAFYITPVELMKMVFEELPNNWSFYDENSCLCSDVKKNDF